MRFSIVVAIGTLAAGGVDARTRCKLQSSAASGSDIPVPTSNSNVSPEPSTPLGSSSTPINIRSSDIASTTESPGTVTPSLISSISDILSTPPTTLVMSLSTDSPSSTSQDVSVSTTPSSLSSESETSSLSSLSSSAVTSDMVSATFTTSQSAPQPTDRVGGFATFYFQNGNPATCGGFYSDSAVIAAVSYRLFGDLSRPSEWCGKRVRVTNTFNGRTVDVTIVEVCPTCDENSLDLSFGAFQTIANPSDGMVPIKWREI